jgi:hypothetical protein
MHGASYSVTVCATVGTFIGKLMICAGTAGNAQNNFQYEYQPTDFPAYMQDADHGYTVNQPLLNAYGIELWSDLRLQFVTSAATLSVLPRSS